jgi:hypothetical protein
MHKCYDKTIAMWTYNKEINYIHEKWFMVIKLCGMKFWESLSYYYCHSDLPTKTVSSLNFEQTFLYNKYINDLWRQTKSYSWVAFILTINRSLQVGVVFFNPFFPMYSVFLYISSEYYKLNKYFNHKQQSLVEKMCIIQHYT